MLKGCLWQFYSLRFPLSTCYTVFFGRNKHFPKAAITINHNILREHYHAVRGEARLEMFTETLTLRTKGEIEFVDLGGKVQDMVSKYGVKNGLVHVFAPHSTGIIILTEDEPGLLEDIKAFLEKLAPKQGRYSHPSNAHSHLRSVLLPPDRTVPIIDGRLALGTWQSLVFVETDVYPRQRTIIIQILGA
jgi:secondary thiamine-phosphate synthase enzyme